MIFIKQYGAKRTGTNYLKYILHLNYSNILVLSNILGWKHGCVPVNIWDKNYWYEREGNVSKSEKAVAFKMFKKHQRELENAFKNKDIRYIVCVKNPYSWLDSMARYLKEPSDILNNKNFIEKQINNWNMVYNNWVKLENEYQLSIIIKYEELLSSFDKTMFRIEKKLNLGEYRKQKDCVLNCENKMSNMSDGCWDIDKVKNKKNNNQYYLDNNYLLKFNKKSLSYINKLVDKNLLNELGYNERI